MPPTPSRSQHSNQIRVRSASPTARPAGSQTIALSTSSDIEGACCPSLDAPPDRETADRLCEIVRTTVEATADLEPFSARLAVNRTPRGLQHRRQIAMYLAHVAFGVRTSDVARCFARDTTTAYYAYRQVEDMRDDPGVDAYLDAVEAIVTSVYAIAIGEADGHGSRA